MNEKPETESATPLLPPLSPAPPLVANHVQLSQQAYPPNSYFFTTTTPSLIHPSPPAPCPPPPPPSLPHTLPIHNQSPPSPLPPAIPNMESWMNGFDMISSSSHNSMATASCSSFVGNNGGTMMEEEMKNKQVKVGTSRGNSRKAVRPRYAFKTRSDDDILDDGYRWRKYGQKAVKNSSFPRSYYRCAHHTCNVKKQVQRLSKDSGIVLTTYEGIHNHPCEKLMETLTPLLRQIQFLSHV